MDLWYYEEKAELCGKSVICGIDEAGRGPLAGPVCAAAVVLPKYCGIEGLNDSKKLSPSRREKLFEMIKEQAVSYAVAFASVAEIQAYNILQATLLAMKRAVGQLTVEPDYILVDGNQAPRLDRPVETIVKGDSKSANIAAASILAKVTRDRLMLEYDRQYPQYQFAKHKGYGTALHMEKIKEYGPCPIHRPGFLKKIMEGVKI